MPFLIPENILKTHNAMTKEECSSFAYQQQLLSELGFTVIAASQPDEHPEYVGQLWAHQDGLFIYLAKNPPQNTPSFSLHFINKLSLREDKKPNHVITNSQKKTYCRAIFSNDNEPWHADLGAFLFCRIGEGKSTLNSQNFLSFLHIMSPIMDIKPLDCLDEEMVKLALFPLTDTDSHNLPKIFVTSAEIGNECARLIAPEFIQYALKKVNPIDFDLDENKRYKASFQTLDAKKFYSIGHALRYLHSEKGYSEFSFKEREEIKNFFKKALTGLEPFEYFDLFDEKLIEISGFDILMQIALLQIKMGKSTRKLKQIFEFAETSYIQSFMARPQIENPYFPSPPALELISLLAQGLNEQHTMDSASEGMNSLVDLMERDGIDIRLWCWENDSMNLHGQTFHLLHSASTLSESWTSNSIQEKYKKSQDNLLHIFATLQQEKLFNFQSPVVLPYNLRWFETLIEELPEDSIERGKLKDFLIDRSTPCTLIDLYPSMLHIKSFANRLNSPFKQSMTNQLLQVILASNVKQIAKPEKTPGLPTRF